MLSNANTKYASMQGEKGLVTIPYDYSDHEWPGIFSTGGKPYKLPFFVENEVKIEIMQIALVKEANEGKAEALSRSQADHDAVKKIQKKLEQEITRREKEAEGWKQERSRYSSHFLSPNAG